MAKFNIISKDGELVRFSGCPKYTGTFLGVSFLEFMSIESPTLIEWEIGDYIDYDRTGLRYKLYSLPIPKKQARAGANGASFVYSNVKFYAETKDLEIASFRDIVPEDNKIHFSTRPDVSTYENVYGLARRIQACMDDVFPDKWRIEVYNTDDAKLLETLNETKDFSISNSNCLQTLSQIYEKWDNVGWIHSYDSAQDKHIITIGRSSIRDNENTSDAFAYGLGNGLTSIKKASTNEDEFATRLYVYGSDRNIQTRYYKGFNILNAESVDIRNLMLPISTWGKTDGLPDARKAYLEADESIIAKYGLIPRTVYFDGSQNEAIYPSIQGLKMSQVREEMITAGQEDSKHLPPNENIRIDKTGYIIISLNSMIFDLGDGSKADVESNPTFLLSLPAVGFDIVEQGALTSEGLATISMKSGPCAGREFKVKSYWGYTNQLPYGYHAYEVYRNWDESLGLGFPNKTYKINEGDEYVLLDIPMPDYYITLAEKRLLEAGQKKLAECTKISPYYEPAIDSIIIKESGKTLREGMYMQISDPDIIDTEDGKDYVLIDTLTIDEKAEIPKYSVTLRKQKKTSKSFAALESRVGASEKSLSTLTSEKAGKSDTYSKANIDNLLKKYLLLEAIKQTVKGDIELEGNLKVKGDIFSTGQFAAAAVGAEGGGSVGAAYLSDLYDVSLGSLLSGDILSWNGSEWVNIKQSSLVPDLSAYASKSFVSDALEGYLPKSGGTISYNADWGLKLSSLSGSSNYLWFEGIVGGSTNLLGALGMGSYNGPVYVSPTGVSNTLLHSGNYSDYALPLSGGEISGVSATPLIIKASNTSEIGIAYSMNDATKGWIGYNPTYGTTLYNYASNAYLGIRDNGKAYVNDSEIYHTGNFNPADYLPLSGGTISGNLDINSETDTTRRYFRMWYYASNRKNRGMMSVDENAVNLDYYSETDSRYDYISIGRNGFKYSANYVVNDVLHSGNIGDYAITSSGEQSISGKKTIFEQYTDKWSIGGDVYNLTISRSGGWAANLAYIANTYGGSSSKAVIAAYGDSGTINYMYLGLSADHNGNNLRISSDGVGFGDNTLLHTGNIGSQSVAYASNAGLLGGLSKADFYKGNMNVIPTVGNLAALDTGCYWVYENLGEASSVPSTYSSLVAFGKSYYSPQMCVVHDASRAWLRGIYNTSAGYSASNWHELAFTDSNVASATKLETPRTIWGQSFDGTGNVDGSLSLGNNSIQGGSSVDMLYYDTSNTLYLGYGMSGVGGSVICGNAIAMRYGSSRNMGFILNASGNVTIGSSDLAGNNFSLVVSGDQRIYRKHSDNTYLDITLGDVSAYYNGYDPDGWMSHYFQSNGKTCMSIMGYSGNVLIGTTTDRGHRLTVGRPDGAANLTSTTLNNSLLFVGMSESVYSYGTNFWTEGSGNGFIQQGRTDEEQPSLYNLILQPFGGNVGIGTMSPEFSLDVAGKTRVLENTIIGASAYEDGRLRVVGEYGATNVLVATDYNGFTKFCVQNNGNVLIGSTTDNGAKTQIVDSTKNSINGINIASSSLLALSSINSQNDGLFFGHYLSVGWIQSAFYGTEANPSRNHTYAISLNPLGGNVLIGTTTDNGAKLQVNGRISTTSVISTEGLDLCAFGTETSGSRLFLTQGMFRPWSADAEQISLGADSIRWHTLYAKDANLSNNLYAAGTATIGGTLTAQNGIVTNEITIGGIKLDVYNGALRVNGDIFSTGQFAASVAGEATGGSNIVLDYASIVNALGYTPANNNNLAQVAFTGSYSSLSGTPDVYTKADVYNKNEINQKLAGVGGGGGSVGSTFGIDYINGQSFDMPNGVNCITSYSEATVNFSSIVPADPSLPCIVYIVKCDYHTLQVTSGCNIISVNSSGDEVIDFSINGMTGMMLVWEPDYWRWFAYLQK